MPAERNKQGIIINMSYAKEEVRRPITTKVTVEKIESLQSSTAGAGSGDFIQYRSLKRREQARLLLMDQEDKQKQIQDEFEKMRSQHIEECRQKTEKKSLKRKKKKDRKKLKKEQLDECQKKAKIEEI